MWRNRCADALVISGLAMLAGAGWLIAPFVGLAICGVVSVVVGVGIVKRRPDE